MHRKYLILLFILALSILMVACESSVTPVATTTSNPTPEPFGVIITTNRASDVPIEFGMSRFTSLIPDEWLAENSSNAYYEITLSATHSEDKVCDDYLGSLTLTYKGVTISVSITDTNSNTLIASTAYSSQLPTTCPFTHTFRTVGGVPVDEIEWVEVDTSGFRTWLTENLSLLPGMPPTATPIATRTPGPSPTSPQLTSIMTPINHGNNLIITGTVVVRDENNNTIATVTEGNFPLIGFAGEYYVILYEGEIAYVRLSAINAQPSIAFTPTPNQ